MVKQKVIESTITSMIEQPSFLLNPIHPHRKKERKKEG
jgi:hypothetical protein